MISNHLNLVEQQRESAEAISGQVAQFLAAGGRIEQLKSHPRTQPRPRSQNIDPETVLQRRRKKLSPADRGAIRKMADSL
ncbi:MULTISPECIES: hypothetical protein [unclassified Pseudomonas]|uniref:hypothetical protein n=1 Tax=unclassified Pseudomonas TaxID=196821 RepID=UPI000A1F48E0|nr:MULTISPECIES: hypothetical protein [unclassified Pseudomonas]